VVGQMAARALVDVTVHGGMCVMGEPTVLIGNVGIVTPGMMEMAVLPGFGSPTNGAPEQLKAMIAAAQEGKPFCEQCNQG